MRANMWMWAHTFEMEQLGMIPLQGVPCYSRGPHCRVLCTIGWPFVLHGTLGCGPTRLRRDTGNGISPRCSVSFQGPTSPCPVYLRRPKANLGQTTTLRGSEGKGNRTQLFECKPKESSNGEPPGAGLHSIYTRIHVSCARLSVGLCTVHDIIVELRARLYDIKGGSMHSTRHRSRLL